MAPHRNSAANLSPGDSAELLDAIARSSTDYIMLLDREGRFLYINRTVPELTPQSVTGSFVFEHVEERFQQVIRDCLERVLQTREPDRYDVEYRTLSGDVLYFESRVAPVLRDGEVAAFAVIGSDVTERMRLIARQRASDGLKRQILDAMPGGLVHVGPDGAIRAANAQAAELLGLRWDELKLRFVSDWDSVTLLEDGRPCRASDYPVSRCLATGLAQPPMTLGIKRPDGRIVWAVFTAIPAPDPQAREAPGAIVTFLDISERKHTEADLLRQKLLFEAIVRSVPDSLVLANERREIVLANPGFARIFGYDAKEAVGQSAKLIYPSQEEFDRQGTAHYGAQAPDDPTPFVLEYARKGGERFLGETVATVVRGAHGETLGYLGIIRDVSERIRTEQAIQQAQKLESLGVMAGGIAHDFNNLLVAVLGSAGLALGELPEDSPARARLVAIETAAQRAADLTNQLLAYAGRGSFHVAPVSLSALAAEMTGLLEAALAKRVRVELTLAPDLPLVEGDVTQLRQVIMNLVTNAAEALEPGGVVRLRTSCLEADTGLLMACEVPGEPLPPGTYVCLEVSDDGHGMDPETRTRIFDPFFTTKFTGRGLGLAAVLGIVRGHQAALHVTSAPGSGTTFRVLFRPVAGTQAPRPAPAVETTAAWAAEGTLLVVDDDASVRELVRAALQRVGFEVLVAEDGPRAIELAKQRGAELRLVLLDVTMPGMDGAETLKRLRAIAPGLRVLLISGFAEQEVSERFRVLAPNGFIQKPFRLQALWAAVRRLLPES